MDAYLNPQPNSGAGQPPQAGAAEVPSPSQQQQQQQQQEQQQPAPSGTSDVAGAGAGKHAKTSPVWLYYREVPVVTEGGKNVRCTVSRTIPATGKVPERTVECGLALTYRRQTDSRKGSGTSGMLDHLKRKHMKAWQDVQNRSSSSATTKKKLGEIYLKYNRPVPALKKHIHPVPSRLEKKIQPPRPASGKKNDRLLPPRKKKTTARPASKKNPNCPVPPRISTPIFCQSRAPAEMKKVGQSSIFPPSRPVEILAVHVKP